MREPRRLLLTFVMATLALSAAVVAQDQRTLPPTPLEARAAEAGARTVWSRFISRLDGGRAWAIVSAVAIESPSSTPRIMRGVRIELRHEGMRPSCDLSHVEWAVLCARENAAIYVEESRLESFRAAVLRGAAEVFPGHGAGVSRFQGSAGSGLLIGGYEFNGVQPANLAALLEQASLQLSRDAPR